MRVLVVEDDGELAETVGVGLRRADMAVDVVLDGVSGLDHALCTDYDVVVLDRDLPGIHGDEVCRHMLESGCRARVLMLTAAGTMDDLVDGLELGADDYLPKPFDFPVLVARIGALYRRAHPAPPACAAARRSGARPRPAAGAPRRPDARSVAQGVRCARTAHGMPRAEPFRPRSCSSESGTRGPIPSPTQ